MVIFHSYVSHYQRETLALSFKPDLDMDWVDAYILDAFGLHYMT